MNKLDTKTRAQILNMLVEGSSMRSIARVCDVSFNTIAKLLEDAGAVCDAFHDEQVRGVASKRVQCDEIWSFCYAKQKNVATAKAAPEGAGDVWTWTGLDADSKLIVSWLCGGRDSEYAMAFMDDLASRLANRIKLTLPCRLRRDLTAPEPVRPIGRSAARRRIAQKGGEERSHAALQLR